MTNLIEGKNNNKTPLHARAAGVLLHITSLPGKFFNGDLGPEAYRFARFLKETGQSYWQLLPLNPVEKNKGYSPYSSYSSRAGNTLLISPELLANDGLLRKKEFSSVRQTSTDKADFGTSHQFRARVLEKAFATYQGAGFRTLKNAYQRFKKEHTWLSDFALFCLLKKVHDDAPWFEWPTDFRSRKATALQALKKAHAHDIELIQWTQFIFFRQWDALRNFCNSNGIRLFGDLPFYVDHDSVDVWSRPELFSVDSSGKAKLVAGVPPDYFNENGQLWGMPVFDWKCAKNERYAWWIDRLKANIDLFDLVRLDHFRAFSAYWAVSSKEKTAKKGRWQTGPGAAIFHAASKSLGQLPFVAEDLGDIDDKVNQLRMEFNFPGMKVLHFAFGKNLPSSDYIPHNFERDFIVYTGTHDNNTTKGWYSRDCSNTEKINLEKYLGRPVNASNIHEHLIRLAYSSVAQLVIVPFQDLAGLGASARMNAPATTYGNWLWQMRSDALGKDLKRWLKELTDMYNRSAVRRTS